MKSTAILLVIMIAFVAPAAFAQHRESAEQEALYKSHCAMCHGPDGSGNTPVGKSLHIVDLRSAAVKNMSDAELTSLIENGKGKMPEFKTKLKPEQIKDLVGYLRELGKSGSGSQK